MESEAKSKRGGVGNVLTLFMVNNKAFVILVVLIIVAQIISGGLFLNYENIASVVRQSSFMCMMGLAFTAVLAAGELDLSFAWMLGLLSVVYGKLVLAMPLGFAIILTVIIGMLCGLLNGLLSIKMNLQSFILTLATGQVFHGAAYLLCDGKSFSGFPNAVQFIGQGMLFGVIPILFVYVLIAAVIIAIILYRTRLGRHIIATGGNANAANVSGVNTGNVRIFTFVFMGLYTAFTALMITGRVSIAMPNIGEGMDMDTIASVIIGGTALNGGKAKVSGTIFGCFILGIISNMLNLAGVSSFWQWVVRGLVIIFALLIDRGTDIFFKRRRIKTGLAAVKQSK